MRFEKKPPGYLGSILRVIRHFRWFQGSSEGFHYVYKDFRGYGSPETF